MKLSTRLLLVTLSICGTCFAQTVTPDQRQQIIKDLDDADPFVRSAAILEIARNKITEAVPLIEQKIWKDRPSMANSYLNTLSILDAPNLYSIARSLIDSADIMALRSGRGRDALELKVLATEYLFKFKDFSTSQYIFEILRDTSSAYTGAAPQLLKDVIKNVPLYADSAKKELLRLAREAQLPIDRRHALRGLVALYGQEMFQEIVYMFVNDDDPQGINRFVMFEILFELNYPDLHNLLNDRLSKESAPAYRIAIADSLLTHFGTPSDYQFVLAYQVLAPNPIEKAGIGRALQEFKPPVPSATTSVLAMLDTLISTKHQIAALGWLRDNKEDEKDEEDEEKEDGIVKKLDKRLEKARAVLVKRDSSKTRQEIEKFIKKVEKLRKESIGAEQKGKPEKIVLTEEGYRFLYYNAQYILDRLPDRKPKKGSKDKD